jgi:hypothetical protein
VAGAKKSLVSAYGGFGLRPASQCHFDAISGPKFQFEAHKADRSFGRFTVLEFRMREHPRFWKIEDEAGKHPRPRFVGTVMLPDCRRVPRSRTEWVAE